VTVEELIKLLHTLPPDAEVCMPDGMDLVDVNLDESSNTVYLEDL
jgi:hypothetical protein